MNKTVNNFKKGDILVITSYYERTDIGFCEVVRTTPCGVELRPLDKESEGNYSGYCWPILNSNPDAETTFHRLNKYGNLSFKGYSYAKLWDGKPQWWNSGFACGEKAKYDEDREICKKYENVL